MSNSVRDFVQGCHFFQMRKSSRLLPSGQLCPVELPTRPFALYGIKHVGPINPISHSGNKYLIVAVDYFTKFVIIRAVSDTSTEVARKFVMEEIVLRLGVPDRIISDRGSLHPHHSFTSSMWAETLKHLGIEYSVATTERPQTNGLVKQANCTIADRLSALVRDDLAQ